MVGRTVQENARVVGVNPRMGRLRDMKVICGHFHHHRVNFHRVHRHIGEVVLVGALRAAAAQAGHQHMLDVRIPEERHLKILRVFKMPGQRIGQRHLRLPRTVEAERADALLVIHLDVMILGDAIKEHLLARLRPTAPGAEQDGQPRQPLGGQEKNAVQRMPVENFHFNMIPVLNIDALFRRKVTASPPRFAGPLPRFPPP